MWTGQNNEFLHKYQPKQKCQYLQSEVQHSLLSTASHKPTINTLHPICYQEHHVSTHPTDLAMAYHLHSQIKTSIEIAKLLANFKPRIIAIA